VKQVGIDGYWIESQTIIWDEFDNIKTSEQQGASNG
jgi:hypothetical protein